MNNRQWANRYMVLRGAQGRIHRAILNGAKFVYTPNCLNKQVLKKDFYLKCIEDLNICIGEAHKNYTKRKP
jgi:hypothetical protein